MKSLIMMLHNTAAGTYHPIFYLESPLPCGEAANHITRYKSKMHHTGGFKTLEEATADIHSNLVARIKENFFTAPDIEIENHIEWNGEGVPADIQIR